MREVIHLNNGWEFSPEFSQLFAEGKGACERVRLPHTCAVTPFHYFDESAYQMICGYRRVLDLSGRKGRRAFICFSAAAHYAKVYLDGEFVGEHKGGYTSFELELTEYIKSDSPLLCVELNSKEDLDIPPFGKVIDYMTYGGLYREVRLEYRATAFISDIFAKPKVPPNIKTSSKTSSKLISALRFDGVIDCDIDITGEADKVLLTVFEQGKSEPIAQSSFPIGTGYSVTVPKARLWDILSPRLYTVRAELEKGGKIVDCMTVETGFRGAHFNKDGFFLNGRRVKIRGLNRHQSYPYVGYAMPRSMQRLDADILKHELACNAVRTSHYPQSQHFIKQCDELGLLVFTEIPGWQNIGGEEWKAAAVNMTKEMVRQYRNHPSVILWGVRINESADDHELYVRTNEAARALDPTRQTGGVRCHKKSELLEDVYTYNDFVFDGKGAGCESKKAVTPDISKGYLITEYMGHMYPSKSFDSEEHRLEHALRHARVLNAVNSFGDISGSFGWCMFDYNTHKEFGSGDRVCYHGVCDMFRNKKLAAEVYSVFQSDTPVLKLSSTMDIGEHPAGNRGRVYIFTNADSVRFYKNGCFVSEFTHKDSPFTHLPRPPIEITDYIGSQIEENESFTKKQARFVKDILNESTRFGMNELSINAKSKAAWLKVKYGMSFEQAYQLYGKYIGNWGDKSLCYRFEAIKNGRVIKELNVSVFETRVLNVSADHTELIEDETYDVALVRIRMTDQNGNDLPFYNEPVTASITGEAKLIGDTPVMLRGGMGGVYVSSIGKSGKAKLTISAPGTQSVEIDFSVKIKEDDNG